MAKGGILNQTNKQKNMIDMINGGEVQDIWIIAWK